VRLWTRLLALGGREVGSVLMSLGPALKGIRSVCAKKVWDARRKR
jgi:hypothetical protein